MSNGGSELLWSIIARVEAKAQGELEPSTRAFREQLDALDDANLEAVAAAFAEAMQRAYDYKLWAAAYIIHGGCGDDAFWDFRAGLIALGKQVYERAVADPDSLVDVEDIENRTLFEGFQYQPSEALESRGLQAVGSHSAGDATGVSWDDSELPERLPRLAARFAGNF